MTQPSTFDLREVSAEDLNGLSEDQARDVVLAKIGAMLAWSEELKRQGGW